MTPARLGRLLGAPPVPQGSWEREAVLASAIPLEVASATHAKRGPTSGEPAWGELASGGMASGGFVRSRSAREVAEGIAALLRGEDGVADVRVQPNGFLLIVLATPGEIVREIVEERPADPGGSRTGRVPLPACLSTWPDFPRTWDNPGFAVGFAHARAAAVRRWARDLGVPWDGFLPGLLDDRHDRAVLRLLAELPSRMVSRDPAWAVYAERLALAYHDAHEHAPAIPMGDRPPTQVHTARLWLARAVQLVLIDIVGTTLPERL